jgi:hypothetical protein
MSCCGKKRMEMRETPPVEALISTPPNQEAVARPVQPRPAADASVYFKYTGYRGLTVLGLISGNTYLFAGSGSVVATDPRDALSLAAVPKLERIS